MDILLLIVGIVVGAGATGLVARSRAQILQADAARLEEALAHERERADEKERYAAQVEQRLGETIEAAAARAVKGNNEEFLSLAGQKLAPIDERLRAFEEQLRALERAREGAYGTLTQQVKGLMEAQELLRNETGKLATALTKPGVRGRWGEITLRRIVELAGMVEHCDFAEREAVEGAEGRRVPDLAVRLPGEGVVAVDAKAPLDAYLAASETADADTRDRKLDEHAKVLREHMVALSRKGYWEQYEDSPDFVVMFVPGEAFVSAAVERRPELFEEGFTANVILATPTTLMALLRVVSVGWSHETAAERATEIRDLGVELHKRIASMAGNFATLGKKLDGAVKAYNTGVGSLERKVLPQARRFEELGAPSGKEVPELESVDARARDLSAPELTDDDGRVRELEPRVTLDDDDYGTYQGAAGGA